jgi:hypothetical protein
LTLHQKTIFKGVLIVAIFGYKVGLNAAIKPLALRQAAARQALGHLSQLNWLALQTSMFLIFRRYGAFFDCIAPTPLATLQRPA